MDNISARPPSPPNPSGTGGAIPGDHDRQALREALALAMKLEIMLVSVRANQPAQRRK